MRVEDVMSRAVLTVPPESSLRDAEYLMRRHDVDHLAVVRGGRLVGVISALDLDAARPAAITSLTAGAIAGALGRTRVSAVMRRPVLLVTSQTPLGEAVRLMLDQGASALPVMRGSEVVGMLTEAGLLEYLAVLLDGTADADPARQAGGVSE
jgi:acetoin utilization protein AcuB